MGKLIGGLVFVFGVVAGLGVGIWIAVLGVIDMVDGAKADPTQGGRIVWGAFEFFMLAEGVGGLIFWICTLVAAAIGFKRASRRQSMLSRKSPLGSSAWQTEHDWNRRMRG